LKLPRSKWSLLTRIYREGKLKEGALKSKQFESFIIVSEYLTKTVRPNSKVGDKVVVSF
jgi:hypothetical protein